MDINLINEANLINNIKDIYNNNINTEKISENYLNKMRILKTAEIINLMFDENIKPKADDDYKKIKILSQLDLNTPTNQDIIVQLIKPNETAIVYGTYTNEQNSQVKYVTIKAKTKVSDVLKERKIMVGMEQ